MSAKKLLMLVGDYAEDYEVFVPYQMLLLVGHRVDAVCPNKKQGETILTAIHDFEGAQTYSEKPGHRFRLSADFAAVRPPEYDGLVIPGGTSAGVFTARRPRARPGPAFRRSEQTDRRDLPRLADFDGRRRRSRDAVAPLIRPVAPSWWRPGAKWIEPSAGLDNAHVDGNLVSAPAWPAHPAWMRAFLQVLGTPVGEGRLRERRESPGLPACGPGRRQLRLGGNWK